MVLDYVAVLLSDSVHNPKSNNASTPPSPMQLSHRLLMPSRIVTKMITEGFGIFEASIGIAEDTAQVTNPLHSRNVGFPSFRFLFDVILAVFVVGSEICDYLFTA